MLEDCEFNAYLFYERFGVGFVLFKLFFFRFDIYMLQTSSLMRLYFHDVISSLASSLEGYSFLSMSMLRS